MKVNVYFRGDVLIKNYQYFERNSFFFDNTHPLNQVNAVEKILNESYLEVDIYTFSPYVLESIDAVATEKHVVTYHNTDGVETELLVLLTSISEAFYRIQEINELKEK